jgi:ABC-type oligopeptide transport system substrate-binding subunit
MDKKMKKMFLICFVAGAVSLAACTGKSADGKDGQKDTSYKVTDTTGKSASDSVASDAHQDSTTNAARMPAGK